MKKPLFYKQFLLLAFSLVFSFPAIAQLTIAEWNFPNNPDNSNVDLFDPVNATAIIGTQGGTGAIGYTQAGATSQSANATTWQNGANAKWWETTISTTGFNNLSISSKQYSSSTGPRDFKIQYRIGAGAWIDLPGALNIVVAVNWSSGVITSVPLPAACNNQTAISIRWIMTSNISVGGGTVASGGNSRIDDINISWNSDDYYRSVSNGNWNNIATWESSPDNITWNPAVTPPSSFAKTITIRNPHTVTINSNVNFDETIVDFGGELCWFSFNIQIDDGPGTDLIVNGTFQDGCTNNVNFIPGSSWQLGASGTMIKTNNGSANNWRDNYQGGISLIPATATWIVRKINGSNPSVSSLLMYYPNLIIENNTAGMWLANGPSSFQGASSNTVVKGYLDIGGSGSGTVEFENANTFGTATQVFGNLNIRTGNILRNYGTGFELYSDLICNGDIIYDANGFRRIIFSGSSAQNISGSGNLNVFNMVMNKSANDLTLSRMVKVDNNITFNNPGGRIFSSSGNELIVEDGATAIGANNSSFVHGPVTKLGSQNFTFPVGKNNDYQSIGMGTGSAGTAIFWTEDFGSGCNTGQLASSYTGTNGSWSITNTGTNESAANTWYVSAAENGNGAGNCGTGCGSNRTLHVSSAASAFGDLGAAYFESDAFICSFLGLCGITDKRTESPVIDCTGRTNISISFVYMEYGESANDNATLWYYDGSTWSQLIDLAKTLCCGNATCNGSIQGLWTSYSIALPASADNNPNVRIGFRWVNNGNGVGTDPSFTVDDIRLSSAVSADSFTAEYFHSNPQTDFNNVVNPFIDHISQCEYWTLNQNTGTSARTVTLTWDGNSCGVNSLADLTVARFNGASWDDRGNGGTTGTVVAGTITSASAQTQYGPFTLASTTLLNPLPVEYLLFSSKCMGNYIDIEWITATQTNCSHFEITRSYNGTSFEVIGTVKGEGTSSSLNSYNFKDHGGNSSLIYYQLKQFDLDGDSHLSQIIISKPCINGDFLIIGTTIISDELNVNLESGKNTNMELNIVDVQGRIIYSNEYSIEKGNTSIKISLLNISAGMYFVKTGNGSTLSASKFIR